MPPRPAGRVINPFLARDPQTRARRLARALISDLVVYHPAKRAEGLRDGTLKLLFDNPSSGESIAAMCQSDGNDILEQVQDAGKTMRSTIRKH